MQIFIDKVSGDELFSDAFKPKLVGAAYEVDCKMITIGVDEINTGANASAEDAAEQLDDSAKQVNDVIHSGRLRQTNFSKKTYGTYIKGYLKTLIKIVDEELQKEDITEEEKAKRMKAFKDGAQALVKQVLANFKDYEFYTGESCDPEGMVALLNYREDGVTPYFTFLKDGLKETKV
ncbi:translationally-controlled tumor protein [Coemansia reversa NRRL 1564]|uniref:Translationally-controlled tumor protein homolog n=1 Tax=Coemansia reversa (strain ATCC 12441 / NRRL 1564) TaxID=763665 RepID=A0A2G5BK05_COERN|nr:translationally-controlled tumor protein [Coemansia reversa NRRL 1564]|eukprot:PIA19340.1 translationally-controlled tumor protein [Coemansia reversa NRRL 1564]